MSDSDQRVTRRAFLRWTLAAAAAGIAAGGGVTGYAVGLEPLWLAVERVQVEVPGLPAALAGLTIAHLSDLHWGPYTGEREIGGAVKAANALEPDLIAVTGDFVYHIARYAPPCAAELAALRAPLGVWAIAGNHDHWAGVSAVRREVEAAGLTWLANSSRRLLVRGTPLWIAGVDDVCERRADLPATLAGIPPEEPVLLLAHEPDFADEVARAPQWITLQLSGHSHGGQVRLPGDGALILPWLGQKYPAGLYSVAASHLQVYTSRGIGVIAPPVRFNCRPEVALITLASA